MRSLTLITPTGGRQQAFDLAVVWMRRQTFDGNVRWIIVNDVDVDFIAPPMPENWRCEVLTPEPRWQPGENTQARNLLAALEIVGPDERVVMIEDDDHYSPDWLETVDQMLDKAELVGETMARYYNVSQHRFRQIENCSHSSMCSTALRGSAIGRLRAECRRKNKFIDMHLWRKHKSKHLFSGHRVVGIKGLPGRLGIGSGHHNNFRGEQDQNGAVLRLWIGADAGFYL